MAGPAALSDVDAVREQLCDVLRTLSRVTQTRQRHDYGSTTAVETISDVQIPVPAVSIPLETDTLPVRSVVRVLRDGVLFRVECRLREVCSRRVTYEIEVIS